MHMAKIIDIKDNEKKRREAEKKARDILKPACDEELAEEEYPLIKNDESPE